MRALFYTQFTTQQTLKAPKTAVTGNNTIHNTDIKDNNNTSEHWNGQIEAASKHNMLHSVLKSTALVVCFLKGLRGQLLLCFNIHFCDKANPQTVQCGLNPWRTSIRALCGQNMKKKNLQKKLDCSCSEKTPLYLHVVMTSLFPCGFVKTGNKNNYLSAFFF